jgi:ubiquinone/menaquinone biosynthesis C-methylase UbiE
MALMIQTPIYQDLMALQIDALALRSGNTVLDLGSGLGTLWSSICEHHPNAKDVRVIELEVVAEALHAERADPKPLRVVADLDGDGTLGIPVADQSCEAVLASLLISYLRHPVRLLEEALRVLRPGGTVVVSTLRRDADFSKIWGDNAAVLRSAGSRSGLETRGLEESLDAFCNDAARVLELEEAGLFEFYEPDELAQLLTRAGFEDVRTTLAFGDPPQAIMATGRRP